MPRGSDSAVRLPSLPSVRDFGAKRIGWAAEVEALLGAMGQGGVTRSIDELVRDRAFMIVMTRVIAIVIAISITPMITSVMTRFIPLIARSGARIQRGRP